jgi:hypothetical protein
MSIAEEPLARERISGLMAHPKRRVVANGKMDSGDGRLDSQKPEKRVAERLASAANRAHNTSHNTS